MNCMFKCQICGKTIRTLMKHVKEEHNVQPQQYYDLYCRKTEDEGVCKVCGNKTKFVSILKGYRIICSRQCKSKKLNMDRSNHLIKNYGIDNMHEIPHIKEKIQNSFNERYSVNSPFESEQIRKKARKTIFERYGCYNSSQNEIVKNKIISTTIKRHGGIGFAVKKFRERGLRNCKTSSEEINKKIRQTCQKRYGGVGFASKILKQKQVNTMLERYGVRHNNQLGNNGFQHRYIGKYTTKYGDEINYQSKLQLSFIQKCQSEDKRILDGDVIPYKFKGNQHLYYCDFKVLQGDNWRLYQIKGYHPWYEEQKKSGMFDAKCEYAMKYSKEKGYLEFKVLMEDQL